MGDRDDELARTATAGPTPSPGAVTPVGATLGRYKLEREIGSGGMGVVHAAFDPDLERRIALKVLRTAETLDARGRLLREARAMARLAHPNVVTVHEVGSASGRDFVAMELISGSTLADWLRDSKRGEREIVDAFVAAGRGLAAAHAAGIVHRDFKPHNVLRSKEGRIVVTDFGLAREAENHEAMSATVPLKGGIAVAVEQTPSSLGGLTQTGSVLGTPAYMAPEQWTGGAVSPATDQFAYCVAMWEALAGERPYRALTPEDLRAQVIKGPAELDTSRLPRRLRAVLVRGLDPDPAKRWPSMDALLARIVRAERRPGVALAIGGSAVAAAAIAYVAISPGGGATRDTPCPAPVRDPAHVWSAPLENELPEAIRATFAHDFAAWQSSRATACGAKEEQRLPQLHCLDATLARMDAVRRAVQRVQKITSDEVAQLLVDPATCMSEDPPRLVVGSSDDTTRAFELYARTLPFFAHPPEAPVKELLAKAELEPCAKAIAELAWLGTARDFPLRRTAATDAQAAAEQCGDENLLAETATLVAPYAYELPLIGPKGIAAVQRAQLAAKRANDATQQATVEMLHGYIASQQDRWDDAFKRYDQAIAAYGARGMPRRQVLVVAQIDALHFARGLPEDLVAIESALAKWQPRAKQLGDTRMSEQLTRDEAQLAFIRGDLAKMHALADDLPPRPDWVTEVAPLTGVVVDGKGKPVAGATVTVATRLTTDSIGAMPRLNLYGMETHQRSVVTDAAGSFTITDAPVSGVAFAVSGDQRNVPLPIAPNLTIAIGPMRKISGKVDLKGLPSTHTTVAIETADSIDAKFQMLAPIAPDGSFSVAGAPKLKIDIGVNVPKNHRGEEFASVRVPAGGDVQGLALAIPDKGRELDVLVRSELPIPLDMAQVMVLPGKLKIATVKDMWKGTEAGFQHAYAHAVIGESAPASLAHELRSGDMVAHFESIPAGPVTVCALGLNADLLDRKATEKIQAHISELAMKCEQLDERTTKVVLEAPPQKRYD